jgi:3-phenylpropionate/trans-cinnamate dioxygenase ferredoxin subunit
MDTPVEAEWMDVAGVDEFESTDRKQVDLGDDKHAGVFKLSDGTYSAISIWCSHQQVSLFPGDVDDDEIMCPLHGARFDLRTGQHLCLPACRPVETFEVKVEADRIYVKP